MTRRRAVAASENEQRDWLQRNVRARREALGLTVTGAAAQAGMHRRHWQKLEAGELNIKLATLVKLSLLLGVEVAALIRKPRAPGSRGEPTLGITIEGGIVMTEQFLRERLAVQVRALRTEQGLTLKVASECGGIGWRLWQKIEAGEENITMRTLARVALALGKSSAELLGAS
jgi:transcriptional regulator with XRE-family HTH domain